MSDSDTTEVQLTESRADGWSNALTGFGTSRDKTEYTTHYPTYPLLEPVIDSMYHGDDICATMVDIIPEECLRKGYELDLGFDAKITSAIVEALEDLGVNDKVIEVDCWGRAYGGAAIVLGAEDGRSATSPLVPENVRKLEWLHVVDRRYLSPMRFYARGPKAGEPETYMYHRPGASLVQGGPSFEVHESRLIIFRGARTSLLERQKLNYWDHSVLQRPYEVIRAFATAYKSVEVLMTDGPQGIYKIKGLRDILGAQGKAKFEERLKLIDMMRSTLRAIVVDKDQEDFSRANMVWSGIDTILDRFMLRLAASVRIPVTILMGQSPAGMNATGDSDFRWLYDRIETRQTNYIGPRLRRLVKILCASKEGPTQGKSPEYCRIKFGALWRPTPKEQAEIEKIHADTAAVYVGADILTPEEAALAPSFPAHYQIDREAREIAKKARLEMMKDPEAMNAATEAEPDPSAEPKEDEAPEDTEAAESTSRNASAGSGDNPVPRVPGKKTKRPPE